MNHYIIHLLPYRLTFLLLCLLTFTVSCNKDPYEIGYDLLPPSDTLHVKTTDTITVEAFSMRQDSVRSDHCSTLILGSLQDPVFGSLTSSFYTHVRLSDVKPDFGKNPVLDSAVLMLYYQGSYGDTLSRLTARVYEIAEYFAYDSLRYTNQRLDHYPAPLAVKSFVPALSDSVKTGNTMLAPHLRIRLSDISHYFGNKILTAPASSLESNENFVKFIKGLYVTVDPVQGQKGALLNFSVSGKISRIILYFRDGDDPQKDSLQFSLLLNDQCARFIQTHHHDYLDASYDLKRQIINHDTAYGSEKLFLQGMGGVKIKLKFPHFKKFAQGRLLAINDAILEMNNADAEDGYTPPASLMLIRQDSAGRIGYLADEAEGYSYFGGSYNSEKRRYQFRLTHHLQYLLMNKYTSNFDLYLMVNSPLKNSVSPNRVILHGTNPMLPGALASRFRLKVTYTVLK